MIRIAMLLLFSAAAGATPQDSVVTYDTEKDLLSIRANEASLKTILGQITLRSGVETLMSPGAERKVNADIEPMPLERALKQFLKGLDHVMLYGGTSASGKPLVTGVEVLPRGEDANRGLAPVIDIMKEASLQASMRPTPEILNLAQKRWQERLSRLPEEKRQQVEAQYEEKVAQARKRQERKEKHKQERERRKLAHEQKKQQREEELKASDPEFYEHRKRQREELKLRLQQEGKIQ